jgi:hypothetical protein
LKYNLRYKIAIVSALVFFMSASKWRMCWLFAKWLKTIFVLRKNKLCHTDIMMKIDDFYVTRKWF